MRSLLVGREAHATQPSVHELAERVREEKQSLLLERYSEAHLQEVSVMWELISSVSRPLTWKLGQGLMKTVRVRLGRERICLRVLAARSEEQEYHDLEGLKSFKREHPDVYQKMVEFALWRLQEGSFNEMVGK